MKMNFPKVTIQIVAYNSLKYLPDCLTAIFHQTYRDFQVLVIDNDSQDGTADWLRRNFPQVTVFQNKKNLGFARANNQGIRLLNSPHVVFCNPDIILAPDWLERIMAKAELEEYKKVGSFGGKLLKVKILNSELNEIEKLDIIDSCGLEIFKSRQVAELGAGKKSHDFPSDRVVFGQGAALALYRREALDDCLTKTKRHPEGEYFDEDFFFYKEDVDLAWRLRLLGWDSLLVAGATAHHFRSFGGAPAGNFLAIFKNRREQSKIARYYSYRNHFFLLVKNEFSGNLLKYFFPICWYELKKKIYLLFFEWSTLAAVFSVLALLPAMLEKRKMIFRKARVGAKEINKWAQ